MLDIKQIGPRKFLENSERFEEFLQECLSPHVDEQTWMTDWQQLAQRFQLDKFRDMNEAELLRYEWDEKQIKEIIEDTLMLPRLKAMGF